MPTRAHQQYLGAMQPFDISAQSAVKYKINSNFLNQKPQNYPVYSAHVLYEINSLTSHPSKWFVSL